MVNCSSSSSSSSSYRVAAAEISGILLSTK